MNTVGSKDIEETYSAIGEKEDVGFLDFEDDKSLYTFDAVEEGPIRISVPFPFVNGKPQSAMVGKTSSDCIYVKNITEDPKELWSVRIYSSNPDGSCMLSLMKPPDDADDNSSRFFLGATSLDDRVLQPGETLKIWLSCKPKVLGLHTSIVHFDVDDDKIERVTFLLAEDEVSRGLFSSKPYTRAPIKERKFSCDEYVPGYRPPRANKYGFRNKLLQYPIPSEIRESVAADQLPGIIMDGLTRSNYAKYFSTLLAMEEIHLEEEMRRYDMECVTMKKRGHQLLSLEVPGLAERRPSLVYGDFVFAKGAADDPGSENRPYQGYIHKVESDEIFLCFSTNLHAHHYNNKLYNISFTYSRVNMRRLYQATHAAENLGIGLLFPSELSSRRVIKRSSYVPLNACLNEEQVCCVEMILGCKGAPPFIIHGPPGTGKTMTLVEAILQVYMSRNNARILVCAPSNSAADHVLQKLLSTEIKEHEIFRLNATSRPYEDVSPDHLRFCFFDGAVFKCAPLEALLHHRIIISTYMSASLLFAEGIERGYFSHIFLDEAGQASEPETMIPLSNLCMKNTVIVLAGDHKQLGPVVNSRAVEEFGLGKSYMERLFEFEVYNGGNENYVKKLVKNYRSHPAILDLPSKLFYNGELIPCTEKLNSSIYEWEDLPNKAFPVLFFGIQGCDEREGNNPSWFNRIEASKVVEVVRKLRSIAGLSESDIGIITPYRQQVLKLKKAFETLEFSDLKVGSVEQFQGQEKEIIIISTVRSTVKHNEFDRLHSLGFLCNPRRFNVSITRAVSLLVIIGNPHIISQDPYWDTLLRYCVDNGSYDGCHLPPKSSDCTGPGQEDGDDNGAQDPPYSNNELVWSDVLPRQGSDDVERGEDLQRQCTYVAELGKDLLRQEVDEIEWSEVLSRQYTYGSYDGCHLPPQSFDRTGPGQEDGDDDGAQDPPYSNNELVCSDVLPRQGSDDVELGEDLPRQCTYEAELGMDLLRQEVDEIEWSEVLSRQYTYGADWGEDLARQGVSEVEWSEELLARQLMGVAVLDEDLPRKGADEVEWVEDMPRRCVNGAEQGEDLPLQGMDKMELNEDLPIGKHTVEAEWGEGAANYCVNRASVGEDESHEECFRQEVSRHGGSGVELCKEEVPKQSQNEIEGCKDEGATCQYSNLVRKAEAEDGNSSKARSNRSELNEDSFRLYSNASWRSHGAGQSNYEVEWCEDATYWYSKTVEQVKSEHKDSLRPYASDSRSVDGVTQYDNEAKWVEETTYELERSSEARSSRTELNESNSRFYSGSLNNETEHYNNDNDNEADWGEEVARRYSNTVQKAGCQKVPPRPFSDGQRKSIKSLKTHSSRAEQYGDSTGSYSSGLRNNTVKRYNNQAGRGSTNSGNYSNRAEWHEYNSARPSSFGLMQTRGLGSELQQVDSPEFHSGGSRRRDGEYWYDQEAGRHEGTTVRNSNTVAEWPEESLESYSKSSRNDQAVRFSDQAGRELPISGNYYNRAADKHEDYSARPSNPGNIRAEWSEDYSPRTSNSGNYNKRSEWCEDYSRRPSSSGSWRIARSSARSLNDAKWDENSSVSSWETRSVGAKLKKKVWSRRKTQVYSPVP